MRELLQNKHLVDTLARLMTYGLTLIFIVAMAALLLWKAPAQAQGVLTAVAYILGALFGVPTKNLLK
jgi:hypothetical protein